MSKETFKAFARNHPELATSVLKNNTTWQAVERIMRNEVKKVSDNKLGEFILRQAIIIKQKKKERAKK